MRDNSDTDTGTDKDNSSQGVTFRDASHKEIPHTSPKLSSAFRVTVTFENQKNGLKMDRRTHERTGDPVMCPVLRLASLIKRILRADGRAGPDTPVSTIWVAEERDIVTSDELRHQLRSACTRRGDRNLWIRSDRHRHQIHPVWRRCGPFPHEPSCGHDNDPGTLVVRCILSLHQAAGPRMDQPNELRHDPKRLVLRCIGLETFWS